MASNEKVREPKDLLLYEAYYKYHSLNRLMRYLAMSLGLLESYHLVGAGFRFDAFEPFRDALLQTYLLAQNLLERSQDMESPNPTLSSMASSSTSTSGQKEQEGHKDLLHQMERQKLLACVQCLAGCVEFSGVGDEKRYLQMCEEALTTLREVQAWFNQARFWYPKWLLEQDSQLKKEWEDFEKNVKGKTDEASKKTERDIRSTGKLNQDDEQFVAEMTALEKQLLLRGLDETKRNEMMQKKRNVRAEKKQKMLEDEQKKDEDLEKFLQNKDEAFKEIMREKRFKEKETARILFLREWNIENEKEWQEKSRTARARDPVLYRSHGPNSYSASKRPKSPNTTQRESDKKPWNPWQLEASQFLLSASRSIGVLRASGKSEGFRFDAFQPFLGALRDTFQLCDKYLKRNETDEEYLTPSQRNTLLAAVVGLAGCVTFTGVSKEEKYGELSKLALEKLTAVVKKLSGASMEAAAAATMPVQQQNYFAQQQQPQAAPGHYGYGYGPQAYGPQACGGPSTLGYWNPEQANGQDASGFYGQMQGWPKWPPTPVPYPGQYQAQYPGQYPGQLPDGQVQYPYVPQLQQPPPGNN